jgi:hypothetical protein
MISILKLPKRLWLPVLTAVAFLMQQCTSVRLIQEYDQITDDKVTALQEKVARFFVGMERNIGKPEAAYDNHVAFYDEVKTDLNVLQVRSKAIPKSEITQKQIESVQSQMKSLEQLHKLGFNSYEELVPAKNAIEQSFAAIIQLQMALKNRVKV